MLPPGDIHKKRKMVKKTKKKESISTKKYSWLTEFLIYCDCKQSPRYNVWCGKIKERNFSCEKCETWQARIREINYIKLPKQMNDVEVVKWMKEVGKKKFVKGKSGLENQSRMTQTTYTTNEQKEVQKRKREKIAPIKNIFLNSGLVVHWYGEVLSKNNVSKPEAEKEVCIYTQKKFISIETSGLHCRASFKELQDWEKILSLLAKEVNPEKHKDYFDGLNFISPILGFSKCTKCLKLKPSRDFYFKNSTKKGKKPKKFICDGCNKKEVLK